MMMMMMMMMMTLGLRGQTRAIAHIREEESRREKRAVQDREALIRELQEQVPCCALSLSLALGLS
eukprot:14605-Rhodomonas_salina.1